MKTLKLPVFSKDKNVNTGIYIAIAALLAFALYKGYKWWKAKKDDTPTGTPKTIADSSPAAINNTKSTATSSTGKKVTIDNDTVLKKGMKGDRVQWLQDYYNKWVQPSRGGTKLVDDGNFGAKTEEAVKGTMGKTETSWTTFKSRVDSYWKPKTEAKK
jgi:hypothetical protein